MAELTIEEKINHLISVSKMHAVLPDEYIPWDNEIKADEIYMPEYLFSLFGSPLKNDLTSDQILQLTKFEVGQIMATYAWSETIGCLMFNEMLLSVTAMSPQGKYMVTMLIEEFRHQYMFTKAVEKIGVTPEPFSRLHRFLSFVFVKTFSAGSKYLVVLAIEQVSDVYAKHYRKSQNVFSVFKKVCELHHIEEARHMAFQKICLEKYISNAGFFRRTKLGIYYVLTIWFMRSQYIKKAFFINIGVNDPIFYYKAAVKNYRKIFGEHCLKGTIEYAKSNGLVNFITRPFWNLILKIKL